MRVLAMETLLISIDPENDVLVLASIDQFKSLPIADL